MKPNFKISTLAAVALSTLVSLNCLAFSNSEQKIGEKQHAELSNKQALYQNPMLNTYINTVGQKLVASSSMKKENFQFFIIDSPEINAFAAPGGYIYINRGLLAYLRDEAELAAVLAHEISHLTEKHHSRQKRAVSGSKALTFISGVLTGSGDVAEAVSLYSTAAIKGFGRDMELEADGQGAKYLAAAGYNRQAMIDILSIFKNHERYSRLQAKAAGKKAASSYHGLFSSHPRNDKRLHQLVKASSGQQTQGKTNRPEFRKHINGLAFGHNYSRKVVGPVTATRQGAGESQQTSPPSKRYYHRQLGISFLYPEPWQVKTSNKEISVSDSQQPQMSISLSGSQKLSPEQFLRQHFNIGLLKQSEPLVQFGLIGHTGIVAEQQKQRRLAVFYRGRVAFVLASPWLTESEFNTNQASYNLIVRSFQPERRTLNQAKPKGRAIYFVKANSKTRFDSLARQAQLGRNGADQLRLINGYYPAGEPRPGEVIKIIN